MQITRLNAAERYEAPNHFGWSALRLHGLDASDSQDFGVVLSYFLPGGGAAKEASPMEKTYVVVSGEITVATDDEEVALGPLDSCRVAAGETRTVSNRTNEVAAMLVIMRYPEGESR